MDEDPHHSDQPTIDPDDETRVAPTGDEAPTRPPQPRVHSDPATASLEGKLLLGRYRVTGKLGQGAMGAVYRCHDEVGGIEVAMKTIPPELARDSAEMEEVRDNFKLVEQLNHPHIASVKNLERDPETGDYYVVMECVEGTDLKSLQRQRGRLFTVEEAAPLLRQIADALDYAHKRRIMHRDIKPANLMLDREGEVKVLDFGLASQIHSSMTRLTEVNYGVSGTALYMAPEQWEGQRQDGATDQYALAVVAHSLLCGHAPFESQDFAVLREAVLHSEASRPPEIPPSAWIAFQRSLHKDRARRFETCSAFVDALEGKKGRRAFNPLPWVAALILLGAAIFAGNYFLGPDPAGPGPEPPALNEAEGLAGEARDKAQALRALLEDEVLRGAPGFTARLSELDDTISQAGVAFEVKDWNASTAEYRKAARYAEEIQQLQAAWKECTVHREAAASARSTVDLVAARQFLPGKVQAADAQGARAGQAYDQADFSAAREQFLAARQAWEQLATETDEHPQHMADAGAKRFAEKRAAEDWSGALAEALALKKMGATNAAVLLKEAEALPLWSMDSADLEKGAAAGLAEYEFHLAYRHYEGWKAPLDRTRSGLLFTQAAQTGHVEARFWAATLMLQPQAYVTAIDPNDAAMAAGMIRSVLPDLRKAVAERPNPFLHFALAIAHLGGITGGEHNHREGMRLLELSTGADFPRSEVTIAGLLVGQEIAPGMEIAEDIPRALRLLEKAHAAGFPAATFQLAKLHANEHYGVLDLEKARGLYTGMAEAAWPEAQFDLGFMLIKGEGGEADPAAGIALFRKSAAQGYPLALFNLGYELVEGIHVEKNVAEAIPLFEQAAAKGIAAANNELGLIYLVGNTVERDPEKALDWFFKGSEKHDTESFLNLGRMHERGNGVPKDLHKAIHFFQRAEDLGVTEARPRIQALREQLSGTPPRPLEAWQKTWKRNRITSTAEYLSPVNRLTGKRDDPPRGYTVDWREDGTQRVTRALNGRPLHRWELDAEQGTLSLVKTSWEGEAATTNQAVYSWKVPPPDWELEKSYAGSIAIEGVAPVPGVMVFFRPAKAFTPPPGNRNRPPFDGNRLQLPWDLSKPGVHSELALDFPLVRNFLDGPDYYHLNSWSLVIEIRDGDESFFVQYDYARPLFPPQVDSPK